MTEDKTKGRHALITSNEAAAYLGLKPGTLEVWRCTKRHQIPFFKIGRLVKYRKSDLDAWLDSRAVGVQAVPAKPWRAK